LSVSAGVGVVGDDAWLGFERMTVLGPNCPVPPWSWTDWESRAHSAALSFISANIPNFRRRVPTSAGIGL